MTFEKNFKASSFCMIGAGFTAIAASGILHWLLIFLFTSVLFASWFINTARLREIIPEWVLNCLSIAYFIFFIFDARLLSQSIFIAVIHLILFAATVKLLTLSKDRDYFFLYLISFTELMASSAITVSLVFGICFLVFLFSGIHTLILFEMRRSSASVRNRSSVRPFVTPKDHHDSGMELFSPFPAGILLVMSIGISMLIIAVAIPLFLLLPRIETDFQRQPRGDTQFVSGFSEKVELGRKGRIQQSDTVVMRVRTSRSPSQLSPDLKWRGLAFDYYDGRAWKRSDLMQYPIPIREGYYKLEESTHGTDWLRQTFFLEALSANVVFVARKVLAVSRDAEFLSHDSAENLFVPPHSRSKLRYEAISDLSLPNPEFMSDAGPIPADIRKSYLQLPLLNSRIETLAKQATSSAGSRHEKALVLERYLRTRYAYGLDLPETPESQDPMEMFLFETRSGHCEYFASAMAIMLRYLEIPSRLVNGFRAGEYNSIGENWTVRQYHAHSWVEAYLPSYGWVEFDPTPVQIQYPRTAFAQFWIGIKDVVDLWWWERVVHYDSSGQKEVVASLGSISGSLFNSAGNFIDKAYGKSREGLAWIVSPNAISALGKLWYGVIPILVLAALLIPPMRKRVLNRMRPVLYRNSPHRYANSFYTEALELLSKYGLTRDPGQTPAEFALSLTGHPAAPPLLKLTHLYNAIRFGPKDTVLINAEAEDLLRSIRGSLKAGT